MATLAQSLQVLPLLLLWFLCGACSCRRCSAGLLPLVVVVLLQERLVPLLLPLLLMSLPLLVVIVLLLSFNV